MIAHRTVEIMMIPVDDDKSLFESDVELLCVVGVLFCVVGILVLLPCGSESI